MLRTFAPLQDISEGAMASKEEDQGPKGNQRKGLIKKNLLERFELPMSLNIEYLQETLGMLYMQQMSVIFNTPAYFSET